MDYKVVWSDRSLSNLKEIVQFIAEDNPFAAERLGNTIIKRASLLAQFPKLGSVSRVFAGMMFAKLPRHLTELFIKYWNLRKSSAL